MATGLPFTNPDLLCELDLDAYGRETTSDLQTLIQDVLHVLIEDLGSNLDDPNRGVGVDNFLSGTQDQLAQLPRIIEDQLAKDDRINTVSANLETQPDGTFRIRIDIGVAETIIPLLFGWQEGQFGFISNTDRTL